MKQTKYNYHILVVSLLMASFSKQVADKFNNQNNPASVPPNLILGTVLTALSGNNGGGSIGALGGVNSWDNVGDWNQYHCQNYNYYGNNIYSWTDNSSSGNVSEGPFNSFIV